MARKPVLWHKMDATGLPGASRSEEGAPCVPMSQPEAEGAAVKAELLGRADGGFLGGHYGWSGTGNALEGASSCCLAMVMRVDGAPATGTRNVYFSLAGEDGTVLEVSQGERKFPEQGGGVRYPDITLSGLNGRMFTLRKDV
ncbi:MAG: hypothetical protein MJ058_04265 [Akkermansia sp.]|nr:hypothetical protein [Akkermansia sp.]